MTDFDDARTRMVDSQLRTEGVIDRALLAAMGEVPREAFLPARLQPIAYIDSDLVLRDGSDGSAPRYLMEPAPFARLVALAGIEPGDVVLDVGCGTGYSAAVLAKLADSVVALESDEELAAAASETLSELEADNAVVVTGDLEAGYPDEAPYDVIVLEGSVEVVPEALLAQLRDGGRLVGVIGRGRSARATIHTRSGDDIGSNAPFDAVIPPLPGFVRPPEFVF